MVTFGAAGAEAQARVAVSLDAGPLFAGVAFGTGGYHETGSVFVGAAFGAAHPRYHGTYGVYSSRAHYYTSGSCWDYYWNSYYDPYSGWYDGCVLAGPYRHSYRARSWHSRWYGYGRYAYVADPWVDPWGPYWAYDPWGSYWNGYWDGYFDGSYWNGARIARHGYVRTVYAYGVPARATTYRPSPLYRGGTQYKESPRGATTRTAQRRPAATPSAPSRTAVAGAVADRRDVGQPSRATRGHGHRRSGAVG
jgi:hypothetical protein